MAIQVRRGNYADFDPSKMVAGEFAVCLDNGYVYITLSPGNSIRLGTAETIEEALAMAQEYMEDAEAFAKGTRGGVPVPSTDPAYHNNSKYYSEQAEGAEENGLISEGYAVGNQHGTPVGSSSPYYHNNSKYYCEKAEEYKDEAEAIVGIGIATTTTAGIVKPDGTTITVDSDGTIHGASQGASTWNDLTGKPFNSVDTNGALTISNNILGVANRSASSGGTAHTVVTTGDKYNWNNKVDSVTVGTTGTASGTSVTYQRIGVADAGGSASYTEINGTKYMEKSTHDVDTQTGEYIFTFTNSYITSSSIFDFYANVYGVAPSSVSVSSGTLTVKFAANDGVTTCRVYIK